MANRIPRKSLIRDAIKQTQKAQERYGGKKGESILEKDKWVMWEDLVNEHAYDQCIMAENEEIRKDYNDRKRSGTGQAKGMTNLRMFRHCARIPLWLWIRMEVQTADPDFWKDKENLKNVLRIYPEYALVPIDTI